MPATATGRGAQAILDGDAQRAARGAYASTQLGNTMYLEDLERAGVVADGFSTPDGTTRTGAPASDYLLGATLSGSETANLAAMTRSALAASSSNPRINPVMTTPPTVTTGTSAVAGLTNIWGGYPPTRTEAFNFYGGVPTHDGVGYFQFNSTTVNGSYSPSTCRIETVIDSVKVAYRVLNPGGCVARFIVNGQYASLTPLAVPAGEIYITLDFTSAGGRARRTLTMETDCHFQSLSTAPTETLTKPMGRPTRLFVIGDSFASGGGASNKFNSFPQVMADLLGARDLWNNGVGGTGYLTTGGQTTFRQRLGDMVTAAPDIAVIVGGHNDTGVFTPAQVKTELLTYLSAIRAQSVLGRTFLIIAGVNGANQALAVTQPMETAMAAAVTSFGDPQVYFVPQVTNAAGPYFTGTGNTASPNGTGNCDIYIGSDTIHPNDGGHAYMARCLADDIARLVL